MPTNNQPKKLPVFWISFIGSIVILILLFLFTKPEREPIDPKMLPWNSYYDETGTLHALGISIGSTKLVDAMNLYNKDVEIRLFTDGDGSNKTAEAYFPTVYVASIKAALAVTLEVSDEELQIVYDRGAKISPTTSGAKEVKLSTDDNLAYLQKKISSITLIPRKNLSDRAIKMRFGEPDRRLTKEDGLERLYYDKLGLEMIVNPEGQEALQYAPSFD